MLRLLAGVVFGLALLWPQPDPDALVAQAAVRILEADREAAAQGDVTTLFATLDRMSGTEPAVRLTRETEPRLERPFRTQLNVHGAAPASAQDPVALTLTAELAEDGLVLHAALHATSGSERLRLGPRPLPRRTGLVPPLLAIGIALAWRRVVPALLAGVWAGAALLRADSGLGAPAALATGGYDVVAVYLRREVFDSFRVEIIGFVVALLGLVGVATRAGGIQGLVDLVLRYARSTRSALAVAYGMGLMMFFDDYANCLVVGNSMRPITDRLRVSREKLAYIVDSTAAPVAGLSLFSTWIAFEVSTYAAQLPGAGITANPYVVFLWSLPFRFYSIFALLFVGLIIWTRRDFGPMLAAERRARGTGAVVRPGGSPTISSDVESLEPSRLLPPRARNALIPIGLVIGLTIEEIFRAGGGFGMLAEQPQRLASFQGLTEILFEGGGAGPLFRAATLALLVCAWLVGSNALRVALGAGLATTAAALVWLPLPATGLAHYATLAASFAAGAALIGWSVRALPTARAHLPWPEIRAAAMSSTRALGFAILILFGAWMIGRVCQDVGTADYLVALTSGQVPVWTIPALLFGTACGIAFATGTSWGTMSILLPNVVALAAAAGEAHPLGSVGMVTVCIGAVLEGAIFGDHCSPISDTTVLASVASGSDHLDHVRTQLPYAVCVALVALGVGYLPTVLVPGWGFWLAFSSGAGLLLLTCRLLGRVPDAQSVSSTSL